MGRFGPTELIIIAVLVLLIFGPRQLPELGRAIGRTLREFRGAAREAAEEVKEAKQVVAEAAAGTLEAAADTPAAPTETGRT